MGFQQIQAPTLRELFVDQVIGMIFSGELRVGDRLPSERELSEQMHISRSMVHTGLEDLERMGFVRMEPRRGNYIEDYARHGNFETLMALGKYGGQFDHAIESSLVEARDAIEGGAMILLGERGTPADIDQLRAITDGLRASLAAGEGIAAYARWMRKFDTTITELSGNLIFPLLMNSLADVSGVLWERCVTFWGPETVIEQETRITAMLAEGRGRDREDKPEYKVKLSCACCFSNKVQRIEHYHNSSWLEHGGSPEKASKTAFVYAIDKYLKDNNKYQKGEARITWQDIEDCIILVSNNFSTQTSYENQTKKAITNKFVQEAMTDFLKSRLETYFIENRVDALKIAEQVLINKRSRESAEKQRLNIKKKLSGSIDISNRVEKFVDCRTRDVSRREIYIVEGDSALGSVKLSRDGEFQGIMPVRGKILNCLKADYPRIFKSEIITDLLKVLGCGVEVPGKFVKDLNAFDINNLRWNKVILCTDADVDGFQIRTLILTMIYRLCPTLIREGYVYIAETPLFEITCGEKTWFAYTDKEKNDIVKTLEGKRYKVDRSKGLGENDPEMMWLTTMNPETRRLIKVMPEDAEATAHSFDLLLGDNLQGRKDHIAENGYKYLEMIDVS